MADSVTDMTAEDEALALASRTVRMILERNGATLGDLREMLWNLRSAARPLSSGPHWPEEFEPLRDSAGLRLTIGPQWLELGFYDEDTHLPDLINATENVGDAIDDLTDLVDDLRAALLLAETDVQSATSWLSFHAHSHWGYHVDHLIQHLEVLLADQP